MNFSLLSSYFVVLVLNMFVLFLPEMAYTQPQELPNILWIVSEDNSPIAGAYGDDFATTPNMDKLAEDGFLYTNAHANAPVCAPARNTIITGVYANSNGNQYMRSNYEVSDVIKFFPLYLREIGYYVTNNAKEDYNIAENQTREIWDESNSQAHYRNREPGQPFFAVFNNHQSHEGTIHSLKPVEELRHSPDEVTLPPYHPDTPEIRRDWAQYYDNIEDMDQWIGQMLQELQESGEAENTIIFYYGDHGGVLPRSKRFVYETGTRVPFIVHIPEKFNHFWPSEQSGIEIDRPISFVDLAPTLLSIVGISIPEFMQGEPFLGDQKTPNPEYIFMFRDRMDERYDMSRAVRDHQYRYIRNYMPYRIYGQHIEYLWRAASMRSWEETCNAGNCNEVQERFWNPKPVEELYYTENDPWEVNNLAEDPAYRDVLERMRKANREWVLSIKDTGFIPEAELLDRSGDIPIYDYMRQDHVPLVQIIEAAEMASNPVPGVLSRLTEFLTSDDSSVRYWGATGILILGEEGRPAYSALLQAVNDPSPNVVVAASEALFRLGETDAAYLGFENALSSSNPFARTHALNAIDVLQIDHQIIQHAVIALVIEAGEFSYQEYDHRAAQTLLKKWGVHMEEHDLDDSWQ